MAIFVRRFSSGFEIRPRRNRQLRTRMTYIPCSNSWRPRSSQQTYSNVRENHNERSLEDSMLSYDQIKRRVAHWSEIELVFHATCPNSCIAYMGPFESPEECPKFSLSRYHVMLL
ncbi:hypothetical protein K439DRAFT_767784 [Ramaria rubella]|nr:hypothetical protein K439DRAFT_767784 [Ramaria rubella]